MLAGLPGCATRAPVAADASFFHAGGDFASDAALDAEYGDLFADDFEFGEQTAPNDPFEGANRALLTFNRELGHYVFDPMVRGYRFAVPEPARRGIHRAFANLRAPSTFVNDLLQLRFKDAGQTLGRFVLNTTLGMAGFFDVGIEAGWQHHEADFGQTLGRMGVGSGPYLMLPVFGPNTFRDGFGGVVDLFFQPLTYLMGPVESIVIGAGSGFSTLDARDAGLKALEESSVDFYAALRSAYLQNRAAHVNGIDE